MFCKLLYGCFLALGAYRVELRRRKMNDRAGLAIAIIRLQLGWVFLVEGILKFWLPDELGAGRFVSIGIPAAHIMGPFVGTVEIVCGSLVIVGLLTRFAAVLLLIDISVAILSTKIPMWLGHGYWRFALPKLKHYGFLSMLHEARTDLSICSDSFSCSSSERAAGRSMRSARTAGNGCKNSGGKARGSASKTLVRQRDHPTRYARTQWLNVPM